MLLAVAGRKTPTKAMVLALFGEEPQRAPPNRLCVSGLD